MLCQYAVCMVCWLYAGCMLNHYAVCMLKWSTCLDWLYFVFLLLQMQPRPATMMQYRDDPSPTNADSSSMYRPARSIYETVPSYSWSAPPPQVHGWYLYNGLFKSQNCTDSWLANTCSVGLHSWGHHAHVLWQVCVRGKISWLIFCECGLLFYEQQYGTSIQVPNPVARVAAPAPAPTSTTPSGNVVITSDGLIVQDFNGADNVMSKSKSLNVSWHLSHSMSECIQWCQSLECVMSHTLEPFHVRMHQATWLTCSRKSNWCALLSSTT